MSANKPKNFVELREQVFKRTDSEARALIDVDLQETRKKTAKLKAQRLAKEAREGIIDLDKKPNWWKTSKL